MAGCWRNTAVLLLSGYCFICAKQNFCTVTQQHDQTIYNFPDVNASGCEFSWADATDSSVLAHHAGKGLLVRGCNMSTLITETCFNKITYHRNCISEGQPYTANCTSNCSNWKYTPGDGDIPPTSTCSPTTAETLPIWIPVAVCFGAFLLGGALLLGFLCSKHRSQILEKICGYTPVDTGPRVDDMAMENV